MRSRKCDEEKIRKRPNNTRTTLISRRADRFEKRRGVVAWERGDSAATGRGTTVAPGRPAAATAGPCRWPPVVDVVVVVTVRRPTTPPLPPLPVQSTLQLPPPTTVPRYIYYKYLYINIYIRLCEYITVSFIRI